MQVRGSPSMENNRSMTATSSPNEAMPPPPTTTFTARRGYMFSLTTLLLLAAFFLCTLLAVSFSVYNFTACDQLEAQELGCSSSHAGCGGRGHGFDDASDDGSEGGGPDGGEATRRSKYQQDVRLPRSLKPLSYNISLEPFLEEGNFTFDGEVHIRVLALEDCYNITMHATELNIAKNDVEVRVADQRNMVARQKRAAAATSSAGSLRIRKQYLLEAKQFFVIELYDKLERHEQYEVSIKFSGLIQDYLQGFYRSSYQTGNTTNWLASTQFQATDARRAFPCFDEPALKANFTLSIARPSHLNVVSNMPIVATGKHGTVPGYVWDHFATTLPMSTYLLAYVISDFSHLSDGTFSVWARSDAIQSARYALSVGPRVLKFLEEFFDVAFPLPKIDMVALPDFQAGAMENWGLITYRETTMLYEEGVSSATNKQRIASVVGHELAHQWFGNLVTPSWWSDIWLNEGFASYMEYLTVDAVEPSWGTLDQFVVNELQNVFQLDALATSHKISQEVFDPDEITELFDRISYGKGSTIIRMMSHFLTSKVFRRGLSKYLREMAYNSAEQDDLWRFLTNEATASGLLDNSTSVKEIMDTWTLQMGYPVVTVRRDAITNVIHLHQARFVYVNETAAAVPKKGKAKPKTTTTPTPIEVKPLWWIPITYTWSKELDFVNTRPLTWIPRVAEYEIENRNLSTADWFIFNIQQTNYYRVNYDLDNWQAIGKHLMEPELYKEIAPANRAQLIDDSMNLARGGYLSYELALNLTRYLRHEEDYVPWKAAITAFNFLDSMFVNQGDYDVLKNYLLGLLENVYNEVGFVGDSNSRDMLKLFKRGEILNMACHLGHRDCVAESIRHFQNWMQVANPDTHNPIAPTLRGIVYCTAIQFGTEHEWDFAFERFLKATVSTEKELVLTSLGCSKEPWILFRFLRRSISGDFVRKQDVYRVFAAVSTNVIGQQIAFDFLRNNWHEIKTYLGFSASNMNMLLKFATKRMNSKFSLNELQSFVRKDLKEHGRGVQQVIEQVRVNVDWVNRNYKPIVKWLNKQQLATKEQ